LVSCYVDFGSVSVVRRCAGIGRLQPEQSAGWLDGRHVPLTTAEAEKVETTRDDGGTCWHNPGASEFVRDDDPQQRNA
jgi:hypothetical protein